MLLFFFGFWKFQILGEEEKGNPKVLSFMEVEGGGRRRQRERKRERVTVTLD